jgi:hypothetical protein
MDGLNGSGPRPVQLGLLLVGQLPLQMIGIEEGSR